MTQWVEGRVVEKRRWTEQLCSLRFEAPVAPFRAGQFTRVALDIEGERIGRPYSYVNAPGERPLEIYFIAVPNGPLTQRLVVLEPGDALWVTEQANGFFTLDEVPQAEQLWLLATGTALGVYLSMLKTDLPWQRYRTIVLVHAVRTVAELTYGQTLDALQRTHPQQLRFVPVVSREHRTDTLQGRIPDMLEDGRLEARAGESLAPERSQLMLCGNPGMVRNTTQVLERRGFRKHRRREPGQITTEKYW